jgi:hypothetical protein
MWQYKNTTATLDIFFLKEGCNYGGGGRRRRDGAPPRRQSLRGSKVSSQIRTLKETNLFSAVRGNI